jgi:hypothetical protein
VKAPRNSPIPPLLRRLQERVGFFGLFEDMRREAALAECLLHFQAHECAGRIARCREIVVFQHVLDHLTASTHAECYVKYVGKLIHGRLRRAAASADDKTEDS